MLFPMRRDFAIVSVSFESKIETRSVLFVFTTETYLR